MGGDGGLTTAERQRLKELERENRELRRSNDILRQSTVKAVHRLGNDAHCWIREQRQVGPLCSELYTLPRQRITTVSNSDIILDKRVAPVRSAMTGQ